MSAGRDADAPEWAARLDADPVMQAGVAPSGFRLPAETRLSHVWLQVADVERSLAYYQRVLGLKVLDRSGDGATLGTIDGATPLVRLTERTNAAPVPQRGHLGLYHFAILLPDRVALGSFVQHLATIGERAGASDHLVSEALYLRDPDGLGIEVYADRPRSSWRAVDSQLQMASDPLDLGDLVRVAAGTPWQGMPAGTTMGHVHLHVRDLDEAAAFYHAAVGLDKMVWSYQGALFLAAGGYHHHLGLNTWAGPGARPAGEDDARLVEWRVVLPSADAVRSVARSVAGSGFTVDEQGDVCLAADPWGTRVRFVAA